MNIKKPLILISNDDGYCSKGIRTLASFLTDFAEVVICAPESARSGFSCAITSSAPIRLKRHYNIPNCELWVCSGTPVDCVKIALEVVLKDRKPDLVLGGINHGDNASVNNHYSGTMGIAREGCMKHIPSIAFSSCDYTVNADEAPLKDYVRLIVNKVLEKGLPDGICLNVNFPKAQSFEGIKLCRMGQGSWINEIDERQHPHGYNYYWVAGEYHDDEPAATDTDRWALNHNYVSVTPVKIDITADLDILNFAF